VEHRLGHLLPTAVALADFIFLLLPLPLIVAANLADRARTANRWYGRTAEDVGGSPPPHDETNQGVPWSAERDVSASFVGSLIWILLGVMAATCVVMALLTISVPAYALVLLVTGVAVALLMSESTRAALARWVPIDPGSAVHATALALSVVLVGTQLASQFSGDVLTQQASSGRSLGPADLVASELPFLLAAFLGVGLFVRRRPTEALERLGLVRPTAWQIVLALGAAGLFFAFGIGADALAHVVTPGIARKVDSANQQLFGQLLDPFGIATIALSAGIAEEALFRGAMQPRLGILWTAFVFATVHTQYGLSLDAAAVFVLAIGLGLLRRLTNTTTSTTCHVVYNTLVGVGVSGPLLVPAVAIEIVLILAGTAALLTGRLGRLRTAP
jgi:uncharacterized protein